MTASAQAFRDVMSCLAMPVTVVSTVDAAGGWHGATLGSVASLSLDPPLVMFALGRGTTVHRPVCDSGRFCISILNAGQRATAEWFAGDPAGRFAADIVFLDGVPAVGAAVGWLLCDRSDLVEAGDHTIVIGRVEQALPGPHRPAGPLLYHGRRYHRLGTAAERHNSESAGGQYQTSYVDVSV
jgi:flavin reductase ActVB